MPCDQLIEDLRAVKDADEIALIRAGGEVCDAIYAWLAEDGLAGREEREVAWAIEQRARELGADGASFSPVVAAGANGAQPHAVPGGSRSSAPRSSCSIWARSSAATAPTARARSRPARASRR